MPSRLSKASSTIICDYMGVKENERVLIIVDKNKLNIGKALFKEADKITKNVDLIRISVGKFNGQEPPKMVAKAMLNYDVILIATSKSLSHTSARRNASEKGARIASMPGITKEIMIRTLAAEPRAITKRSNKIIKVLNNAYGKREWINICTKLGTDIKMKVNKELSKIDEVKFYNKGDWGNLPYGEVFFAPLEGSTNGVYIVDASMAGIGRLKNPIRIEVKDGYAIRIEGKEEAKKLRKLLKSFDDKRVYNIAELGIGTNDKAKISGTVLEDEKVLGTAHISLGNNKSYGGTVNAPVHLDGVFFKPTIIIGKNKIMENGKLLI